MPLVLPEGPRVLANQGPCTVSLRNVNWKTTWAQTLELYAVKGHSQVKTSHDSGV